MPEKKTKEAAGCDLHFYFPEGYLLKAGEIYLAKTGFSMEIPVGYFADIRPRSGFSTKTKILIPNAPGTIDSDYRGEIMVPLFNLSGNDFFLEHQTRIAQILILPVIDLSMEVVEELSESDRGKSGFGSTGSH